jgi:hypothetical protein
MKTARRLFLFLIVAQIKIRSLIALQFLHVGAADCLWKDFTNFSY